MAVWVPNAAHRRCTESVTLDDVKYPSGCLDEIADLKVLRGDAARPERCECLQKGV